MVASRASQEKLNPFTGGRTKKTGLKGQVDDLGKKRKDDRIHERKGPKGNSGESELTFGNRNCAQCYCPI